MSVKASQCGRIALLGRKRAAKIWGPGGLGDETKAPASFGGSRGLLPFSVGGEIFLRGWRPRNPWPCERFSGTSTCYYRLRTISGELGGAPQRNGGAAG